MTKQTYDYLSSVTGRTLAWGMLTGVRPTKLAMQKLENGMSKEETIRFLEDVFGVSPQKAALGCEIAQRERDLLGRLDCKNGLEPLCRYPILPQYLLILFLWIVPA